MGLALASSPAVAFPGKSLLSIRIPAEANILQTPLLVLIFFAPESPWWLVRKGRKEEAKRSLERLGRKSDTDSDMKLAMIERTVEIETQLGGSPSLLDLVKGTDLRRTVITCLVYASQNFAGKRTPLKTVDQFN